MPAAAEDRTCWGKIHHTHADNTPVPFPTRAALEFLTSKMSSRQEDSVLGEASCSGVQRKPHPKSCCQRKGVHRGPGMPLKLLDAVGVCRIQSACTTSNQVRKLMKPSLNNARKSLYQTLALIGVCNCPDIFSKGNMAGHKQLREIFGGCQRQLVDIGTGWADKM